MPKRRVAAVLGPTNTGKTTYAIERMLAHRTGIIGLPLRLLAREVYDRIVALRGPSVVALVTGEERIVPPRTQYWVATVEAMPDGLGCDFLAVDEIQLCADPERGHVFTNRLLHARGLHETLFLGAEAMRGPIAALVPGAQFLRRERMSQLSHTGARKIGRMRPRSAIVGFSVENVYAIAELVRRLRGGAAVVMGALSPRTRNAQVAMYQAGEVDFLVATDAIGMGLNLDIDHVAFFALQKFDGHHVRALMPHELAQIAGRAGRGQESGSFGTTGEAPALPDEVAAAIEAHRFTPFTRLMWRNSDLDFGSVVRLIATLDHPPDHSALVKTREADDLAALRILAGIPRIASRSTNAASVRLLWDVCRIPDFRNIGLHDHSDLIAALFCDLHDHGHIAADVIATQIRRLDRPDGGIDMLSRRLAYIRTWTYIAQRSGWVEDENHWRAATRAVEDRLSDALHQALTKRFVDRRTSLLLRRLGQKEAMLAEINAAGEVRIEGALVGRLNGFRFTLAQAGSEAEAKTIRTAAFQALGPHFQLRADRFYNASDTGIDFTEQGELIWGDAVVGKLTRGQEPLRPRIEVFVDDIAGPEIAEKVHRRLQHFVDRRIATLFEPLLAMQKDAALTGPAKGFAFRMGEGFGIVPRQDVAEDVRALDQEARGALRKYGVRFGQFTIFMPALLKPAPTRLRLLLWALAQGLDAFAQAPPPGLVTLPAPEGALAGAETMSGYRIVGTRAIRVDMLERLADMIRAEDSRAGFEAKPDMLSITGLRLDQFAELMQGLGYTAERGERIKIKPAPAPDAVQSETPLAPEDHPQNPQTISEAPEIVHPETVPAAPPAEAEKADDNDTPEMEVYYVFTWGGVKRKSAPNKAARPNAPQRARHKTKRSAKPPRKAPAKKPPTNSAKPKPQRKEKPIDPDNPFAAALMGLKNRK